ncbi:MAG: gliding motility-associated C-terminal domain-containing protein [Bacteroidia bacterium]
MIRFYFLSIFAVSFYPLHSQVYINTELAFSSGLEVIVNDSLIVEENQSVNIVGTLIVAGNSKFSGSLQISGLLESQGDLDFESPGSFGAIGSELFLNGQNQFISGSPISLYRLNINSSGIKTLGTDVITQEFNLGDGRLHTGGNEMDVAGTQNNDLTLGNGWVSSDAGGRLSRNMLPGNVYDFPVGDLQEAYPAYITPNQSLHCGFRYAGNSATDDGLSLFQVDANICRLRDDSYVRLYNYPAGSAEVRFSLPVPLQGNFNVLAARISEPFQSWQVASGESPEITGNRYIYTLTPQLDEAALVPGRIRPAQAEITGPTESCQFAPDLVYTASGVAGITYIWNIDGGDYDILNDSAISVIWTETPNAQVSVVASDEEGCSSASVDKPVHVFNLPVAIFDISPPQLSFAGMPYTFVALSEGAAENNFSFEDGSQYNSDLVSKSFALPGDYSVILEAISAEGCRDTASAQFSVEEGLILSNVFTPNGDGFNDYWELPSSGIANYHLIITDRWGTTVFETNATKLKWDGRSSSGEALPAGTYFYLLDAESAGQDYSSRGTLQIIY